MLLLAFPPENLIFYGDFRHYFNLAALTQSNFYPFIHYWYEFPPIFPYLNIGIYNLAGQELKNYIVLLAFVMTLIECGNLYLIYRLALTLHGPLKAIQTAWIYTAIFVPTFFIVSNFDALTTFFILLTLYGLLKNRQKLSIIALALGIMVKFLPVILVATIWRQKGFKPALGYTVAAVVISLLTFSPFFLINSSMTVASLMAQVNKSSYQTVWALLDGNYTTGNFGPISDHFDAAKATQLVNNPALIPSWLTFIPFGLLGIFILTRPRRLADTHFDAIIFTALTFVIFFLWAPGWSPQWQTFLIPLLLLCFPESRAVLFVVVLGFVNFLEWPVIISRGLTNLLPITIIARTFIFVILAIELYQILQATNPKVRAISTSSRNLS